MKWMSSCMQFVSNIFTVQRKISRGTKISIMAFNLSFFLALQPTFGHFWGISLSPLCQCIMSIFELWVTWSPVIRLGPRPSQASCEVWTTSLLHIQSQRFNLLSHIDPFEICNTSYTKNVVNIKTNYFKAMPKCWNVKTSQFSRRAPSWTLWQGITHQIP